jgi:phosphoglycolate phosphatase-like HAD superfamily hydrolase
MSGTPDPRGDQIFFSPSQHFFIGIDSDGCVFDTMETKHKECFIPNIIRTYNLACISKYVRETAEFINLYSVHRGVNRFPGLVLTMDLLIERAEVLRRRPRIPSLTGLRGWIARETRHSNPALKEAIDATGDRDLVQALEWSEAVNRSIADLVKDVPPFPFVRESVESMQGKADVMVVSATPGEALVREWQEHGLRPFVSTIAGQELGSKRELLQRAAAGQYAPERMLMVGDAPGDLKAAEAVGALFYPIDPGAEDASWQRFFEEGLPRFFAGNYAGAYMTERIAHFRALLPERPLWRFSFEETRGQ